MIELPLNRRALLSRTSAGLAALGALGALGGGASALSGRVTPAAANPAPPTPFELLRRALALEVLAEFAFEYVPHHYHLPTSGHRALRELRIHERLHARRITQQLAVTAPGPPAAAPAVAPAPAATAAAPGAPPSSPGQPSPLPRRPRTLTEANALLSQTRVGGKFTDPKSPKQALELLLRIEYSLEGSYMRIVEEIDEPGLAVLAAEIMAVEAQHVTLLRILHQPDYLPGAVPDAFVVGPT